jgi:hypothetical protein
MTQRQGVTRKVERYTDVPDITRYIDGEWEAWKQGANGWHIVNNGYNEALLTIATTSRRIDDCSGNKAYKTIKEHNGTLSVRVSYNKNVSIEWADAGPLSNVVTKALRWIKSREHWTVIVMAAESLAIARGVEQRQISDAWYKYYDDPKLHAAILAGM